MIFISVIRFHNSVCFFVIHFTLLQLLEEVKKVQFRLNNLSFHFDAFGNLNTGYNVLLWHERNRSVQYSAIGSYTNRTLQLDQHPVQWHTRDNEVRADRLHLRHNMQIQDCTQ
ncbi:hypothetical protein NDU88_011242 [Pleurodeles waltl]|uniref:MHC class I antigen n=1 Tax=Pleurodeles waltl TaxID=8319 RepID=A0AAV7R126_PLEWA|nr:hypothetical protein NDU88_011242 [Pleurodeles waltl]